MPKTRRAHPGQTHKTHRHNHTRKRERFSRSAHPKTSRKSAAHSQNAQFCSHCWSTCFVNGFWGQKTTPKLGPKTVRFSGPPLEQKTPRSARLIRGTAVAQRCLLSSHDTARNETTETPKTICVARAARRNSTTCTRRVLANRTQRIQNGSAALPAGMAQMPPKNPNEKRAARPDTARTRRLEEIRLRRQEAQKEIRDLRKELKQASLQRFCAHT